MKPTPQQELHELLVELFVDDPAELRRRMLRRFGVEFVAALPPNPASFHDLVDAVMRCAAAQGVEETLLSVLVASHPGKRGRIAEVAERFGTRFSRRWDPGGSANVAGAAVDAGAEERAVGAMLGDYGPFIGRRELLSRIAAHFKPVRPRPLVLAGHPGVGKSALARQFALEQWGKYSAVFEIPFTPRGLPTMLASIGLVELKLPIAGLPLEEQCKATVRALASGRRLLIYDNVTDPAQLRDWMPPAGSLCHVLATTNWEDWRAEWQSLPVPPLPDAEADALVAELVGDRFPEYGELVRESFKAQLVGHARGLPVQLRPATLGLCTQLRKHHERGTLNADEIDALKLSDETEASFDRPWALLRDDSRRLLGVAARLNPAAIPREVVCEVLAEGAGVDDASFRVALDGCFDLHLIEGRAPLRMHALLGQFVRGHGELDAALQAGIGRRFVAAADEFCAGPGDHERANRLLVFPLDRDRWPAPLPALGGVSGALIVSRAAHELGDHENAYAWAATAVAEAEAGDAEVDRSALGEALYQLGIEARQCKRISEALTHLHRAREAAKQANRGTYADAGRLGRILLALGTCHLRLREYAEAVAVLEEAREVRLGQEALGPLDHEALGQIGHKLGQCLLHLGDQRGAIAELRRALAAKREGSVRGVVHGRRDHASIGKTLHLIGVCHWQLFEEDEAIPYLERAEKEYALGDMHGRKDHVARGHVLVSLASCYSRAGRWNDLLAAAMDAEREIRMGDIRGEVSHVELGNSLKHQARYYEAEGRYHDALTLIDCAIREHEQGDDGFIDHYQLALCLDLASICQKNLGHRTRAVRLSEQAVAALQKRISRSFVDSDLISRCFRRLGINYYQQADTHGPAAALDFIQTAVQYAEKGSFCKRIDHELLGLCLQDLGQCLRGVGRLAEAADVFARAETEMRRGDRRGQVDAEAVSRLIETQRRLRGLLATVAPQPGTCQDGPELRCGDQREEGLALDDR